jgi:hypothetical protein
VAPPDLARAPKEAAWTNPSRGPVVVISFEEFGRVLIHTIVVACRVISTATVVKRPRAKTSGLPSNARQRRIHDRPARSSSTRDDL